MIILGLSWALGQYCHKLGTVAGASYHWLYMFMSLSLLAFLVLCKCRQAMVSLPNGSNHMLEPTVYVNVYFDVTLSVGMTLSIL